MLHQSDYEPCDRFEYDFGEVKLMINGQRKTFYLAVMTSPWSGYRAACLYENQKSQVFFESMIRFSMKSAKSSERAFTTI